MDAEVLTEVPATLKRLIRYIVRGFYTIEHALIIDMLVHHPCMKEDDMLELLKFERKHIRALLVMLKNDKFIKVRMRVETDAEDRTTRHNYYFINYSTFVNVVKYKLDIMRKKIEMEERESTSRASFNCPSCTKTFTDLEADQLFDPSVGQFLCTFCQTEVEEEATTAPKTDARTLMVKFNEQISPIFALLREVEDVKLAHSILEPEPVDLKDLTGKSASHPKSSTGQRWSGDATKSIGFGDQENKITIDVTDEATKTDKMPTKETPAWISTSTVEGAAAAATSAYNKDLPSAMTSDADVSMMGTMKNDDIMRTLLAHEKKGAPGGTGIPSQAGAGAPHSDNDTSTSEEEDDEVKPTKSQIKSQMNFAMSMKSTPQSAVQAMGGGVEMIDSDDDDDAAPMVTVGHIKVPYNEVTEEMVDRMTPGEKEEYIRLGQEMYENMYD